MGLHRARSLAPTAPVLADVRARLVGLIAARAPDTLDRYADLRSGWHTHAAGQFTFQLLREIEQLEHATGVRVRKRRGRSGVKFADAIHRLVGDLLRARVGEKATGRIYRVTGKDSFKHDPVKYDMFWRVVEGLKALGLIEHRKGQTRYRTSAFGPEYKVPLPGRAARFWATSKLIALAEAHGIHAENISDHFVPEPPRNPLVLRDYAVGRGVNKERGRIIKDYERTTHTKKLEADVRELNEFFSRFRLEGGLHYGYTRCFNLRSWNKGGRLYSDGQGNYQQLPESKRHEMTINGEPVAEIDIKASFLTIYHAKLKAPLAGTGDPYARAGVERLIAKQWMVVSFGNSKPATRWPPEMSEDYEKETGQVLRKEAKASDVARKMLKAFPALERLDEHSDIWADLQFLEAEAIVGTMLILMRAHRAPSLSMHDGLIVPRSKADLAKGILAKEYRRVVGVEPMLTVELQVSTTDSVSVLIQNAKAHRRTALRPSVALCP